MRSASYFDSFSNFRHDPKAPIESEFARLAVQQGWSKKGMQYKAEHGKCLEHEFANLFGHLSIKEKLGEWQDLCYELGIETKPPSITQCKKLLRKVHVNIVDLLNSRRSGTAVKIFSSFRDLQAYTIHNNKVYPKAKAKCNPLLKILLRGILEGEY